MSEKPERQRIVEEAIEWMVRLQSGDFSAAEGDALERWKALSSEHAEVSRRPSGLRKTTIAYNSLAHRTTWLRSDFAIRRLQRRRGRCPGTLEGAVERACRG
ncbi:FecR/PupR family sigma factor regulator, partial [Pseudomonas aeruginosa]|uniref:FecR/PupR family sigma factor regulator n=1 Tax=Pseudomonas aeruginosa TaxID=287 RepID=UPI0023B04161